MGVTSAKPTFRKESCTLAQCYHALHAHGASACQALASWNINQVSIKFRKYTGSSYTHSYYYILLLCNVCSCLKVASSVNTSDPSTCSSRIWGVENTVCDSERYTGSVCRAELLAWQGCVIGQAQPELIAISVSGNQEDLEQQAAETLQLIGQQL